MFFSVFFIALKLSWRDFLGEPCFLEDTTLSQIKEALTKLLSPFVDSQMSSA